MIAFDQHMFCDWFWSAHVLWLIAHQIITKPIHASSTGWIIFFSKVCGQISWFEVYFNTTNNGNSKNNQFTTWKSRFSCFGINITCSVTGSPTRRVPENQLLRIMNSSVCSHCLRFQSKGSVSVTGGREVRIWLCSKVRWGRKNKFWKWHCLTKIELGSRPLTQN